MYIFFQISKNDCFEAKTIKFGHTKTGLVANVANFLNWSLFYEGKA
jgi:hypothetical protein